MTNYIEVDYEGTRFSGKIRVRAAVLFCPACGKRRLYTTGRGSRVYYCTACFNTYTIVDASNGDEYKSEVNRVKAKAIASKMKGGK